MNKATAKIDLDKLKEIQLPDMQRVIDYCTLHETTGVEAYRKLAIDNFRSSESLNWFFNTLVPTIVQEFYPLAVKKFGLDEVGSEDEEYPLVEKLKILTQKLKVPVNMEGGKQWRQYCLGCKKADASCCDERKKLEDFRDSNRKGLEKTMKEIIEVISSAVNMYDAF